MNPDHQALTQDYLALSEALAQKGIHHPVPLVEKGLWKVPVVGDMAYVFSSDSETYYVALGQEFCAEADNAEDIVQMMTNHMHGLMQGILHQFGINKAGDQ